MADLTKFTPMEFDHYLMIRNVDQCKLREIVVFSQVPSKSSKNSKPASPVAVVKLLENNHFGGLANTVEFLHGELFQGIEIASNCSKVPPVRKGAKPSRIMI